MESKEEAKTSDHEELIKGTVEYLTGKKKPEWEKEIKVLKTKPQLQELDG